MYSCVVMTTRGNNIDIDCETLVCADLVLSRNVYYNNDNNSTLIMNELTLFFKNQLLCTGLSQEL